MPEAEANSDLQDTDKSRRFAKTEFNDCLVIKYVCIYVKTTELYLAL